MPNKRKHPVIESRLRIKDLLPFGYGQKIAKKARVCEKTLCDYWNGDNNNDNIRKALRKVLTELEAEELELSKKAERLRELKNKRLAE